MMSLAEETPPKRSLIPSGVYVEEPSWEPFEGSTEMLLIGKPVANQFPFCWDITRNSFLSLNIVEIFPLGGPFFKLISIPFQHVPLPVEEGNQILQTNRSQSEHVISGMTFPLFRLFLAGGIERRSKVFFDISAFNDDAFYLYITYQGKMTIWNYNKEAKDFEDEWSQIQELPIEFEGPFRLIQLGETTYIFSESTGTFYLLEGDRLQPAGQLPEHLVKSQPKRGSKGFLIDKDRQEVLFYGPDGTFFAPLQNITGRSMLDAEPDRARRVSRALRSALDVYGW
jgi:hypothetical protein